MLKTEIEKSDCCGCGACYQICAAKALSMRRDIDGFEYPVLDRERCSDCGRCKTVCPMNPTALKRLKFLRADNALAAVHKDAEILRRSSSGGAFSAVVGQWRKSLRAAFSARKHEDCLKYATDTSLPLRKPPSSRSPNIYPAIRRKLFPKPKRFWRKEKPWYIRELRARLLR